uniref:Uncharacterized protein n=1 Tax=Arundo donax TaxID=35708 RepID=A0A0A9DQM9_ARUDO
MTASTIKMTTTCCSSEHRATPRPTATTMRSPAAASRRRRWTPTPRLGRTSARPRGRPVTTNRLTLKRRKSSSSS